MLHYVVGGTVVTMIGGNIVNTIISSTIDILYSSASFLRKGKETNKMIEKIHMQIEEMDIAEGAKWEATKGAISGALHGAVRGAAIGNAVAPGPGTAIGAVVGGARGAYKGAKRGLEKATVKESFKEKYAALKEEQVDEGLLDLATSLFGKITNVANKAGNVPAGQSKQASTELMRNKPKTSTKTSWKQTQNTVQDAKLKNADLTQAKSVTTPQQTVKENKMTDIRKMVTEDIAEKDITINGRTVTLNTGMAKRILEVYDSVNTKNKKIVEGMLNEDLESFKKLLNFSIRK